MFLGAFERVFKGLQKTGLNWSRPVNINWFFCSLYISKKKRWDRRSGLLQAWSGLVTVFFRSRDRTSKHYSSMSMITSLPSSSGPQGYCQDHFLCHCQALLYVQGLNFHFQCQYRAGQLCQGQSHNSFSHEVPH